MRKLILSVMGLALLGGNALLGQAPSAGPTGQPVPGPTGGCCGPIGGCCGAACCPKTKTICVPEHYEKERKKVVYTFGYEKKCLPYCHGLFECFDCGGCDKGHCGHALTVKYLVKKVRICEHDAVKCKPVEVPACRQGGCCADASHCDDSQVIILTRPVIQPPVTAPNK